MDCVEGMKLLDDNSIDLVVTSPPYDNLRKYNGYCFSFEKTAQQLFRIIKPGGIVVWIVNDATMNGSETGTSFNQALYFKSLGFNLHDTMIFAKNNPVPLTHNRYEQQFEYMFVLSKGKPKTFNPLMKDNKNAGKTRSGTFRHDGDLLEQKHKGGKINTQSRLNNIWFYNVGNNLSTKDNNVFKHPASFPEELASDHISSWSNSGDIVLDPFMGSGTTAVACKNLNVNYIGFDISKEYCELAEKRLQEVTK